MLLKVEEICEQPSIHDINALKHNTKDSDNKDTTKTITGLAGGELVHRMVRHVLLWHHHVGQDLVQGHFVVHRRVGS